MRVLFTILSHYSINAGTIRVRVVFEVRYCTWLCGTGSRAPSKIYVLSVIFQSLCSLLRNQESHFCWPSSFGRSQKSYDFLDFEHSVGMSCWLLSYFTCIGGQGSKFRGPGEGICLFMETLQYCRNNKLEVFLQSQSSRLVPRFRSTGCTIGYYIILNAYCSQNLSSIFDVSYIFLTTRLQFCLMKQSLQKKILRFWKF